MYTNMEILMDELNEYIASRLMKNIQPVCIVIYSGLF